jgi:hypothetical protein
LATHISVAKARHLKSIAEPHDSNVPPMFQYLCSRAMLKPNYRHAKRQKDLARKTKQQLKQQRRAAARANTDVSSETAEPDRQPESGKQDEILDPQS